MVPGEVVRRMRWAALGMAIGLGGCATVPAAPAAATAGAPSGGPALAARAFVGATGAAVRESLGPPGLSRTDGPAVVWLYRSAACEMTLVLYRDTAGTERVASASALAAPGMGRAACLGALARRTPATRLSGNGGPS